MEMFDCFRKWREIGSGSFNTAYVNRENTLVLKAKQTSCCCIIRCFDRLDDPDRSVRLWNLINKPLIDSGLLTSAKIYYSKRFGKVWISPYIQGRQATTVEINNAREEIHQRTQRYVKDAHVLGNFLVFTDKEGVEHTVCVDVGYSFDTRENVALLSPESAVSNRSWRMQSV